MTGPVAGAGVPGLGARAGAGAAEGAFGSGVGGAALATRGAGSAAGREGVALEASVPFPAGEASADWGRSGESALVSGAGREGGAGAAPGRAARDFERATVEYKKAVDFAPKGKDTPQALLRLGLAYRAQKKESDARQVWNQLVRDFPESDASEEARRALRGR